MAMTITEPPDEKRAALVAIVGRANVGKSSLLNALLGEKVSIESPVAQTTRTLVRGVLTEPRGQLAFLDTPGVHRARTDLGRLMNRSARAAVEGVDAVLLVVDASVPPAAEDEGWMRRLCRRAASVPLFIALNKTDLGKAGVPLFRAVWETVTHSVAAETPVPEWIEVSARTRAGLSRLLDRLFARAPRQPFLFPEDIVTDYPRNLAIADIVREKLFLRLHDEVPHRIAVATEHWIEHPDGWVATVTVFVEHASQKGIVIGHKGRMLRAVRRAAEAELRQTFGVAVTLDLTVKVEPNWTRNYWFLKRIGYA